MKVLVVSPVPTHPTLAGNCVRILRLIEALEKLGHEVHFLHINFQLGDTEIMQSVWGERFHAYQYQKPWRNYDIAGIPIPDRISRRITHLGYLSQRIDQFYDYGLDAFLRKLHEEHVFDAVMVEYVFFSAALDALPNSVCKLIDTHDVYTNRHRLLRQNGMQVDWFFTSEKEETKGLSRADAVIAIQDKEQQFFQGILPNESTVLTVGHFIEPVTSPPPQALKSILMVGSLNPINTGFFQRFIDECWLPFYREHPGISLKIAGGVCGELTSAPGCQLLGFVDKLGELYADSDLVVNPILSGTGLKIKSLEALSHGRALIAGPAGLDGLGDTIPHSALQADNFPHMQKLIENLLNKPERLIAMSKAASAFAHTYYLRQLESLDKALKIKPDLRRAK